MGKKSSEDDIFKMYSELIDYPTDHGYYGSGIKDYNRSKFNKYNTESETFITTGELLEQERKLKEDNNPYYSPNSKIDETFEVAKRYNKPRVHKYTQKEMDAIKESCSLVIVHDYGDTDIYHMSDEERAMHDQLSEIRVKLGGLKRLYGKVDEYIEAMRVVYEAWSILASTSYLHTRDEFFEAVGDGIIVSNSIIRPKLRNGSRYNFDKIVEYISNPELNPKDLVPHIDNKDDEFLTYEEIKENMEALLSKAEIDYIMGFDKNTSEPIEIKPLEKKYIKGYNSASKKNLKKMKKKDKAIRDSTRKLLTKIQNNSKYRDEYGGRASFTASYNLFEREDDNTSPWDDVIYANSWSDDTSSELYGIYMDEKIMEESTLYDKTMTYGDVELKEFFRTLESKGVNIYDLRRNISGDTTSRKYREREKKLSRKENKRLEEILINRITSMNNDPKFKKKIAKSEKAIDKYNRDK